MKKELYQMLEMILKSAQATNIQAVNIRRNPLAIDGMIVEATDDKRAIQIITKEAISEGLYKIAKTGKEYTLLLIPVEKRERFPDIDRVMYKETEPSFVRDIKAPLPDIVEATIHAHFGSLQESLAPGKQTFGINIIRPIWLDVIKPWCKISDIFKMKCTTPNYPVQIESESEELIIKFAVMPFCG